VGEVFVVKFFHIESSQTNQYVSKDDQNHNLGDAQGTHLYQHKSRFVNFQTLFLEHYKKFAKLGAF
jgi:hypothetical protein